MGKKIFEIRKDWVQDIIQNLEDQIVQAILEMGDEAHTCFTLAPYSLGYLFGFCTAGFETHRIEQDLEKVKILIQVYAQLLGEAGREILQTTLDLHTEEQPQFREGSTSGREEFLRWIHRGENPIGLLRYVLRGEKTQSLSPKMPARANIRPALQLAG